MTNSNLVLSIGSNKDRDENLKQALANLQSIFKIVCVSAKYEFDCIKAPHNPRYLNQIVIIESKDSLENINECLKKIEKSLRKIKTKEECSIDIDLIFTIKNKKDLIIINKLKSTTDPYIVVPCSELIPDLIHPEKNLSFLELSNQMKILNFRL